MSIFPYLISPGAILQFYNLTVMYLTQNVRKNKVNVDLEFLFISDVNNGDRYSNFGNTVYCWVSKAVGVGDIVC